MHGVVTYYHHFRSISDGRMSGTAFGTIVLHVTPESAIGGPLAHVRSGDRIRLSVKNREISLLVSDAELAQRARDNPVIEPTADRGYRKLFLQTVTQADKGVDFDFMRASTIVGKTPQPLRQAHSSLESRPRLQAHTSLGKTRS